MGEELDTQLCSIYYQPAIIVKEIYKQGPRGKGQGARQEVFGPVIALFPLWPWTFRLLPDFPSPRILDWHFFILTIIKPWSIFTLGSIQENSGEGGFGHEKAF